MPRKRDSKPVQIRITTLLALQAFVIPLAWLATLLWQEHWSLFVLLPTLSWFAGTLMGVERVHAVRGYLLRTDVLTIRDGQLQPPNPDLVYQIRWIFWGDLQWVSFLGSTATAFTLFVAHAAIHTPRELINPLYWFTLGFGAVFISLPADLIAPWLALAYVRLLRSIGWW